jgi:ABC-type transport system involved in multi-copper enzyme maturation permease subunit
MFRGVLALLERSLRVDARSWPTHLARFGLLVAISMSLHSAIARSILLGAPGRLFFQMNVYLNLSFMTLLGVGFFSTAITEEKEEDTLGLIQMAGVSPLGILLGKIGGRLSQALLLIAVQYPFTLLAVTLGGVAPAQITAVYVALTSYMLMLAGLGLLCSTVAPNSRAAGAWMSIALLTHAAVSYTCIELLKYFALRGGHLWSHSMDWIASTCIYFQVGRILTSSFTESPWSQQAVSNIAVGAICAVVSLLLFTACTQNPATESASRGLVTQHRGWLRWFSPGRPKMNPFVWKDFHFVGGGVPTLLVRTVFYLLLLVFCQELTGLWWSSRNNWRETIGFYQVLMLFLVTWELAMVSARTLHDEVRGQTLASLVLLPTTLTQSLYSKFTGAILATLPGLVCLLGVSFLTHEGQKNTEDFLDRAAGWFFLAHFILVPHLAAYGATFLRWGAVPLAIGGAILSGTFWIGGVFNTFRIGPNDGMVGFVGVMIVIGCCAMHAVVIRRVVKLSQR